MSTLKIAFLGCLYRWWAPKACFAHSARTVGKKLAFFMTRRDTQKNWFEWVIFEVLNFPALFVDKGQKRKKCEKIQNTQMKKVLEKIQNTQLKKVLEKIQISLTWKSAEKFKFPKCKKVWEK